MYNNNCNNNNSFYTGASLPRNNGVSSAPLLRAITEQQSAEEREAANYQLQTTASGSGEEDYEYERLLDQTPDNGAVGSQLGWTYVDYMKAAGLDPGERKSMLFTTRRRY